MGAAGVGAKTRAVWRPRRGHHIFGGLVQYGLALRFRGVGDELLASSEQHLAQIAAVLPGCGSKPQNESNAPGDQKGIVAVSLSKGFGNAEVQGRRRQQGQQHQPFARGHMEVQEHAPMQITAALAVLGVRLEVLKLLAKTRPAG